MRGPRPRPGLKKRKIPRHAGNFILRSCVRRTTAGVSSAPKPSQYAVGEGFDARPAWATWVRSHKMVRGLCLYVTFRNVKYTNRP